MFIVPTQPQTAWQVVRSGFSLWKSTFRFVWPFSLAFATLGVLLQHVHFNELFSKILRITALSEYYIMSISYGFWIAMIMVISLFYGLGNTVIIHCIHQCRGKKRQERLVWTAMLKKTRVVSMIIFLTMIMYIGSGLLLLRPIVQLAQNLVVASYPKVVFEILCIVIPIILLTVYLAFSYYIAIVDNRGVWGSIRASFALVSKHWWFSIIRLVVVTMVTGLLLLGVCLVTVSILAGAFFFWGAGTDLSTVIETNDWMRLWTFTHPFLTFIGESKNIQYFFAWTASLFFNPFGNACMLEIFYDLRLRKAQSNP